MDIAINESSFDVNFEPSALRETARTLERGAKVAAACSGGADSVFLLLSLLDVFAESRRNICALHFNHKARPCADADQKFVEDLCARHGVELFCGSPAIPPKKHTEAEFRQMRLAFFKSACAAHGIALIAQGHHSCDAAESLLMRISRGGGIDALCAPAPVSSVGTLRFARPLLDISKSEIKQMLAAASQPWREDETNLENTHFRNKIRNLVLPQFEAAAPNIYAGARRTQKLLSEDTQALRAEFDAEFDSLNPRGIAATAVLSEKIILTRAYLRRALMKLLQTNSRLGEIRANAADAFLDEIRAAFTSAPRRRAKTSVGDSSAVFDPTSMTLSLQPETPPEPFELRIGIGTHPLPDGGTLLVKKITLSDDKKSQILAGDNDDSRTVYLDVSCFGDIKRDTLTVRTRRDGDAYTPLGGTSPKKLKELFSAKKLPLSQRKSAIVVCNCRGEILWTPSVAPADKYKITNSRVAIELTLRPKDVL